MAIESGVIVGWPSTGSSIPSGWTIVSTLGADQFTRGVANGSTDPGGTGGAASHTHTTASHTHTTTHSHPMSGNMTATSSSNNAGTSASLTGEATHTHTNPSTVQSAASGTSGGATPNTSSQVNDPPYLEVLWIESDGTPTQVPSGAVAFWSGGALPGSWTLNTDAKGKYLRGKSANPTGAWTSNAQGSTRLNGVAYGNGLWVAVGETGNVIYKSSPDGSWSTATVGSNEWQSVAYGNGYWVVVSSGGALRYATTPGGTWTSNAQGSNNFNGVTYANGYWVAVGANGTLYYKATDPTGAWTSNTQSTNAYWFVAYGNGYWLLGSDSGVTRYRATDPTGSFTSNTVGSGSHRCGSYANGYWVIGSGVDIHYRATDPTSTFTSQAIGSSNNIVGAAYDSGYWVLVSVGGRLYYRATDPAGSFTSNAQGSNDLYAVLGAGGSWVATGDVGTVYYKIGGGGATGAGNSSHTHATADHTHSVPSHSHTGNASGQPSLKASASGATARAGGTHTHLVSGNATTHTSANQTAGETASGSGSSEPPYYTLGIIESPGDSPPTGLICVWRGTLASIPAAWLICNGSNGTPNLFGKFIKGVTTSLSEVGNTGGGTSHTHSNPGTHAHVVSGTHATTVAAESASSTSSTSGAQSKAALTSHTHTGVTTGASTDASGTGTAGTYDTPTSVPLYYDVAYIWSNAATTVSGSFTADSIIKKAASSSFSVDAIISNAWDWVAPPANGGAMSASPMLTLISPNPGIYPCWFQLQLDTSASFNTGNLRTYRQGDGQGLWEYYNGSTWVTMPSTGLDTSFKGNQVRFTVPDVLSNGTWYRRFRWQIHA